MSTSFGWAELLPSESSLDYRQDPDGDSLGAILPAPEHFRPDVRALRKDRFCMVVKAVNELHPRERLVIFARFGFFYGEEWTLQAVGGILGLSKERCRQIEREALAKLKAYFITGRMFRPHSEVRRNGNGHQPEHPGQHLHLPRAARGPGLPVRRDPEHGEDARQLRDRERAVVGRADAGAPEDPGGDDVGERSHRHQRERDRREARVGGVKW